MPAIKETPLGVDMTAVVPEPVTKEIPKCGENKTAEMVSTKKVETTGTVEAQNSEVSSSLPKNEGTNRSEKLMEEGNGSVPQQIKVEEKPEAVKVVDSQPENGNTSENGKKPDLEPTDIPKQDGVKEDIMENPPVEDPKPDFSEGTLAVKVKDPEETKPDAAGDSIETKSAEDPVETKPDSAEDSVDTKPDSAEDPVETKPVSAKDPVETEPDSAEDPIETKPDSAEDPVETKPDSAKDPVETKPDLAEDPVETKPDSAKDPVETKPDSAKDPVETISYLARDPVETKPDLAKNPVQTKLEALKKDPVETKPDSAKDPIETKPEVSKDAVKEASKEGGDADPAKEVINPNLAQESAMEVSTSENIKAPVEELAKSKSDSKSQTENKKVKQDSTEAAAKDGKLAEEKMIVDPVSETKLRNDEAKDNQCGTSEEHKNKIQREDPTSSEQKSSENPSSETSKTLAGTSSSAKPKPDVLSEIDSLKKLGLAQYVQRNFCAAADSFGKVLELQAPLYGEMSEKLAETYFLYGSAMYEYGKTENTVLGEKVKEKDEETEEDEEESGEGEEEKMEVEGSEEKGTESENKDKESEEPTETLEGDAADKAEETITGEGKEEDEDDAFRVSWEMLELAKATFQKGNNKKRLADTLMKLGEVGIETGNSEAISEMLEGLKVRKENYPENHRIVPETHFNIGVAFAYFEKYDDAIKHFSEAKSCLEKRIEVLTKSELKEDQDEIDEIKQILPDIEEKIKDTEESKADKEKIKEETKSETSTLKEAPFPALSESKPVSDISHLIRRKRKVDDIAEERVAKQSRQEGNTAVTTDSKGNKTDDVMTSAEGEKVEVTVEKTVVAENTAETMTEKEAATTETAIEKEPTAETTTESRTTEKTTAPESTTDKATVETKTETNVEKMEE